LEKKVDGAVKQKDKLASLSSKVTALEKDLQAANERLEFQEDLISKILSAEEEEEEI
jgi:predicted  nucleic acid-binding Zn-ribbon protein